MKSEPTEMRFTGEPQQRDASARGKWLGGFASVLASAVGLACPACIPALASLLASLGIGLAAKEQFVRPLLVALLVAAVGAFAWSAKLHRQWWIVATGVAGGALVYLGRYFGFGELWMNQAALWAGTAVLIGTSVINLRLKRGCSGCANGRAEPKGNRSCCTVEQAKRDEA
jgi:hypothetical protein